MLAAPANAQPPASVSAQPPNSVRAQPPATPSPPVVLPVAPAVAPPTPTTIVHPTAPPAHAAPASAQSEEIKPPPKLELLDAPGLLKYGIGVGVAAAFVSNVGKGDTAKQSDLGVSAMPYVAMFPLYWFLGSVTREYCAARRLLVPRPEAQARADKLAEYYNKLGYERPDGKAYVHWEKGKPGKCFGPLSMLGLYGGIPLGYSANFTIGGEQRTLEVKPRGSFGLVIAPIAYINFLVGVTRVAAQIPEQALDRGWYLTFGVGGTLDIFAKLLD